MNGPARPPAGLVERRRDGARLRTLVAEDSPTARQLMVSILNSDPELQVVAQARDGLEAVELVAEVRPDVIVMDVTMPEMDGLEATRRIMALTPTPIVLVSASFEPDDVNRSFEALEAGALQLLPKPRGPDAPGFADDVATLTTTTKLMAEVKLVRRVRGARIDQPGARDTSPRRADVVAIASSTGGPAALARILGSLPQDVPGPILVVQHITTGFHQGLADWLDRVSSLSVVLARDGQPLRGGEVLIAPSDAHLGVSSRGTVALRADPPIRGHRPSATHLFQTVADVFGDGGLGVMLTGMGDDGVAGLRALKDAGGLVLAQDEESCVVYGMPREAVAEGVVDEVVPLDQLAAAITAACHNGLTSYNSHNRRMR
jgi:two-component system, chemotaxis family, protein-glutamate methylesterase/glutaminase